MAKFALLKSGSIAASAVLVAALISTPATAAADSRFGGSHFLECLQYLFSDSAAHALYCLPPEHEPFAGLPETGGHKPARLVLPPPRAFIVVVVSEAAAR